MDVTVGKLVHGYGWGVLAFSGEQGTFELGRPVACRDAYAALRRDGRGPRR